MWGRTNHVSERTYDIQVTIASELMAIPPHLDKEKINCCNTNKENFGQIWAPQSRIVQQIEAMSSRQSWNEEEDDSDSDGGNKKVRKMTQKDRKWQKMRWKGRTKRPKKQEKRFEMCLKCECSNKWKDFRGNIKSLSWMEGTLPTKDAKIEEEPRNSLWQI